MTETPWFKTGKLPPNVANKITLSPDGCWLWTAATTNGYGVVQHNGRIQRAHRVVYTILAGPIPDEAELDHFRMNPGPRQAPCARSCVNPDHVEPVPPVVNNARGRSVSAEHARQTHCLKGHEFTPENTYLRKRGHKMERFCRECCRERDRKRYENKKTRAT